METTVKLNDAFPGWLSGGGVFALLQQLNVPWKSDDIAQELDIIYHGGRSGDKPQAPVLEKVEPAQVVNACYVLYATNWAKEWATLSAQYDPIENYSMTETMDEDSETTYGKKTTRTDDLTHTKTGRDTVTPATTETQTNNLTHKKTGTEKESPDITDTNTPNTTVKTDRGVYGFNSSAASNSDTETKKETGTTTNKKTGTDTTTYDTTEADTGSVTKAVSGTDTTEYNTAEADTGTQATQDSGADSHNRSYTLKRSGNIGVTTSQQMLQAERDLWKWNYFNDIVFRDLDSVLTLRVY